MPFQKVGPYDIFGTIGKGNFCRVKFATNRETKTSMAIKILDKQKLRENGLIEATKNEISIMKRLHHANCVGIHDMYANPVKIIIVVDLVMGISLQQIYKTKKMVSEDNARKYFIQLSRGMQYCHDLGIVLGGLELDGILVEGDCSLRISDFGRAGQYRSTMVEFPATRKHITAQYAAPEQLTLEVQRNEKTDIWSLGIVLFAILAGYMPFDWKPLLPDMLRNISLGEHEAFPLRFSPHLNLLLDSMLKVDPRARPSLPQLASDVWANLPCSQVAEEDVQNKMPMMFMDQARRDTDKTSTDGFMCNIHVPFAEYFPALSLTGALQSIGVMSSPRNPSQVDVLATVSVDQLNHSTDQDEVAEVSSAFQEIDDPSNISPCPPSRVAGRSSAYDFVMP